jgi:serine/threonine protein kinase
MKSTTQQDSALKTLFLGGIQAWYALMNLHKLSSNPLMITDTLRFLHSKHIIHGDLTCGNIFLDEHLNAKLGDFGGSSLDGSPLLVEVTASYKYPGLLLPIVSLSHYLTLAEKSKVIARRCPLIWRSEMR